MPRVVVYLPLHAIEEVLDTAIPVEPWSSY